MKIALLFLAAASTFAVAQSSVMLPKIDGQKAYDYTKAVVDFGPRPVGSAAHAKTEQFILTHLKQDGAEIVPDPFVASTPDGKMNMRNIIAKFPGAKDGIIVIAGHFDTKKLANFVGANDAGSSTGILLALADKVKAAKQSGYSVWLVFLDGEEAFKEWNINTDSDYGSRHLAKKWAADGTAKKVRAFILADMIGDKDLGIEDDSNSDPALKKIVYQAAQMYGTQSRFFVRNNGIEDDHIPFKNIGVPVVDIIDLDYAPWHTPQDTMDKLSVQSFQTVGDVILETVRLLDQR